MSGARNEVVLIGSGISPPSTGPVEQQPCASAHGRGAPAWTLAGAAAAAGQALFRSPQLDDEVAQRLAQRAQQLEPPALLGRLVLVVVAFGQVEIDRLGHDPYAG